MENLNWQLVIEFAVAVAAIAITIFLVPWLKDKLGTDRYAALKDLIWEAVQAAEQLFGAGNGAQKKAYVVEHLENAGIDAAAVDMQIESAVLAVNKMVAGMDKE